MNTNDKIYIAGHLGMVGSAIELNLFKGMTKANCTFKKSTFIEIK
jgi:hypothetical protein